MKIGANLTEEEAKAFKAREELELAAMCGGESCIKTSEALKTSTGSGRVVVAARVDKR